MSNESHEPRIVIEVSGSQGFGPHPKTDGDAIDFGPAPLRRGLVRRTIKARSADAPLKVDLVKMPRGEAAAFLADRATDDAIDGSGIDVYFTATRPDIYAENRTFRVTMPGGDIQTFRLLLTGTRTDADEYGSAASTVLSSLVGTQATTPDDLLNRYWPAVVKNLKGKRNARYVLSLVYERIVRTVRSRKRMVPQNVRDDVISSVFDKVLDELGKPDTLPSAAHLTRWLHRVIFTSTADALGELVPLPPTPEMEEKLSERYSGQLPAYDDAVDVRDELAERIRPRLAYQYLQLSDEHIEALDLKFRLGRPDSSPKGTKRLQRAKEHFAERLSFDPEGIFDDVCQWIDYGTPGDCSPAEDGELWPDQAVDADALKVLMCRRRDLVSRILEHASWSERRDGRFEPTFPPRRVAP